MYLAELNAIAELVRFLRFFNSRRVDLSTRFPKTCHDGTESTGKCHGQKWRRFFPWLNGSFSWKNDPNPIGSMYGIFTYIYHKIQLTVG